MKFDYYWRIALILALLVGMTIMFVQFKNINKEGNQCLQNPFVYGANKMGERYDSQVSCSCFSETGSFTFNDQEFNPDQQVKYKSGVLEFVNLSFVQNV
ncbi:MAG: hypothetical protein WD512_12785 [Candidatus Paceibacterota bacterium]